MRNSNGTFTHGNPGGPGRPPRQIEREYLRAMLAGCSLEDWKAIVVRAVADAKGGDAKAREWLAHYLIGDAEDRRLFDMATDDELGIDPVEHEASRQRMFQI